MAGKRTKNPEFAARIHKGLRWKTDGQVDLKSWCKECELPYITVHKTFIQDGHVVMVDTTKVEKSSINPKNTYAIVEGEFAMVKKLRWQGPRDLWVYSGEQSREQAYPIPYEDIDDLQIIGRVIWVGHEVK